MRLPYILVMEPRHRPELGLAHAASAAPSLPNARHLVGQRCSRPLPHRYLLSVWEPMLQQNSSQTANHIFTLRMLTEASRPLRRHPQCVCQVAANNVSPAFEYALAAESALT